MLSAGKKAPATKKSNAGPRAENAQLLGDDGDMLPPEQTHISATCYIFHFLILTF